MIIYDALVLDIDKDVEEQVLLDVEGYQITGFASVCPYPIRVGGKYKVGFYLFTADEFFPYEVGKGSFPSIIRDGDSFRHTLTGKLTDNTFDFGIRIEDEIFTEQYGYLNGKIIRVNIDRIDIEFF